MKNNNLETLKGIMWGECSEDTWTALLVALGDFHDCIARLEEIERERSLVCGNPTAERPCGEIVGIDEAAAKELGWEK